MKLFPAFLKIAGRRCLVVGAGPVGEEKSRRAAAWRSGFVRRGAEGDGADSRVGSRREQFDGRRENSGPADLQGAFLVVAATSSPTLHGRIYSWQESEAFCATWSTIRSIAISITAPWCGGLSSDSDFYGGAKPGAGAAVAESNSSNSLARNTNFGSRKSEKRGKDCLQGRSSRGGGSNCCTGSPASFRLRSFSGVEKEPHRRAESRCSCRGSRDH